MCTGLIQGKDKLNLHVCKTDFFFVTILQLKTQLNETLSKLKVDQNERQKVAGDLPKVSRDPYEMQIFSVTRVIRISGF